MRVNRLLRFFRSNPPMTYKFSNNSKNKLTGVHPDLVAVCEAALAKGVMDFCVTQGVRTKEMQERLYAQGRTEAGPIVTWTLFSKHLLQSDGYGHAVDLAPWPINWHDTASFLKLSRLIKETAKEIGVKIEAGADWKKSDLPHFELAD